MRNDRQHQDHCEAGVDRAGHETGRKDGRMPARKVGDREVKAHHDVNREGQRRSYS